MKLTPARTASILVSVTIFVIIIVIAFFYREELGRVFQRTEPVWLAAGVFCFGCNYLSRAYRVMILSGIQGVLFSTFLKISGIHGFSSYFLPMRSGDFTLPFLLRLHAGISLPRGGGILVRARMLDVVSLGYLLFFATLFTSSNITPYWLVLLMVLGLACVIIPLGIIYFLRKGTIREHPWLHKVTGDGEMSYPSLGETLTSLVIWFWIGSTIYCVIRSLDIPLSFFDVWFLVAIQLPLQMLPVQGLANTGNHEAGWVLALTLFGIAPAEGMAMALASHVMFIFYALLLGVAAILLPSRKESEDSESAGQVKG